MSKSALKKLEAWHQTRRGLAVFGLVELVLAYILASRAIDTGSWWEYGLTLLLLVGGLRNVIMLIGSLVRGRHKTGKA